MAEYKISGVWKNEKNVITHYAFHTIYEKSISKAQKKIKVDAIKLLETRGNSAITWLWDYNHSKWKDGEEVKVVDGDNGKYLKSNKNDTKTDNLGHLIDFDWISS